MKVLRLLRSMEKNGSRTGYRRDPQRTVCSRICATFPKGVLACSGAGRSSEPVEPWGGPGARNPGFRLSAASRHRSRTAVASLSQCGNADSASTKSSGGSGSAMSLVWVCLIRTATRIPAPLPRFPRSTGECGLPAPPARQRLESWVGWPLCYGGQAGGITLDWPSGQREEQALAVPAGNRRAAGCARPL